MRKYDMSERERGRKERKEEEEDNEDGEQDEENGEEKIGTRKRGRAR